MKRKFFFKEFANIFDKIINASLQKDKQAYTKLIDKDLYELCNKYHAELTVKPNEFFKVLKVFPLIMIEGVLEDLLLDPFKFETLNYKRIKDNNILSPQEFLILYLRNPFLISNISIKQAVNNINYIANFIIPLIINHYTTIQVIKKLDKENQINWGHKSIFNHLIKDYKNNEEIDSTIIDNNGKVSAHILKQYHKEIITYIQQFLQKISANLKLQL